MTTQNKTDLILNGNTFLGIELGSTRIKAALIAQGGEMLAQGSFTWENRLENGFWTYHQEEILSGIQACYKDLSQTIRKTYGVTLSTTAAIGISAMMHGYLAFDKNWSLLVPFRTWRNTTSEAASAFLSRLFEYNIPARWSVSHYFTALSEHERHVPEIAHLTTLAGYIHHCLSGENVLGIGDASGMFPIDPAAKSYRKDLLARFDALKETKQNPHSLEELLPAILCAGQPAGHLSEEGARLLDPSGTLKAGIPMCPPEGDAGTGMTATNSVLPRTGNVSAGTSIFAMAVLERPLRSYYPEIDVVATPDGHEVAMVHCNNGCSDIDAWAKLFAELIKALPESSLTLSPDTLYQTLYQAALQGDADAGGLLDCNYISGESITDISTGIPMFIRTPESKFTLANFMRSKLYSSLATLRLGMDILQNKEQVGLDRLAIHGGFVKQSAGREIAALALKTPVTVYQSSGEGGPWGMALLASYMLLRNGRTLDTYLSSEVFSSSSATQTEPRSEDEDGFIRWMDRYRLLLKTEALAEKTFAKKEDDQVIDIDHDPAILALKKRVFEANQALVSAGLVVLTWGNVSAIDRERGLVVIKPSGVPYETMTEDDMVVLKSDGTVISQGLRPSSDTPTHLYLYRTYPELGGIVHTHSVNATSFAQAGRPIPPLGTTHADCFFGEIPVTRLLTDEEIQGAYEENTGVVIQEALNARLARFAKEASSKEEAPGILSMPAVLVNHHGPFTFASTPEKAVEAAITLESTAEMALKTMLIASADTPHAAHSIEPVSQALLDKHYQRKHGKNAYYGQG